ncbi:MAG: hypothetical protein PWP34_2566 [Desulfuromonadales bacterium]|jgi:hypothetical protein|nr:hypothetical protein [Desulfuromonadales bacterium]
MIFLKESLYGWGVCNIPQPRVTRDVFADRRMRHVPVEEERRLRRAGIGLLALCRLLLRRDLRVLQTLSVVALSLSMIILFGLAGLFLPLPEEEENPPLEILAMVMDEPIIEPPPVVRDAEPQTVQHPEPNKAVVQERANPAPKPVEPPPAVKPLPVEKVEPTLPPRVVSLPAKPEDAISLPGPQTTVRQYRESIPAPGPMPAGKPDAGFDASATKEPVIASARVGNRYQNTPETSVQSLPKRRQTRFSTGTATEVDLPSSGGLGKNFTMAHAAQSLRGTGNARLFVPGNNNSDVEIRGAVGIPGGVEDVAGDAAITVAPSQHDKRGVGERVGMVGGTEDVDIPVLVGTGSASGSLGGRDPISANPAGDGSVSGKVVFNGVEDGHYDPAKMISLNQLKACIDPNAENPLKESLAAGLDADEKCSVRNMVFFFIHPENAYTLQVDIYNPENFIDRCDALRTALQCINP